MEKIAFIVDRLNQPPFNKEITTMTELDSKMGNELFDLLAEVIVACDPEQEAIYKEPLEFRVRRVMQFLSVMKFNIPEDHLDDFQNLLLNYDKEVLYTVMNWCLSRFEHLQKRAYLSKYLMPLEIPAEFLGDDLIAELSSRLKDHQIEFKEIHKQVENIRASGIKPSDLKAEISQLEQEKVQLTNKISKMRKDSLNGVDEDRFKEMLKATSSLRKEQENEVLIHERLREHRKALQEAEMRFNETNKRFSELKSSGITSQSAEQILFKLQSDVRELNDRRESLERMIIERESHVEKLQSWDSSDRIMSEDDVRLKRDQVNDLEDHVSNLTDRLDSIIANNTKLVVSRQASTMALKKFREKEEDIENLSEVVRRLNKQIDEKEAEYRQSSKAFMKEGGGGGGGGNGQNKINKKELKRYGAVVKEKIEVYKKMREELSNIRSELVILQRTEQILKSRDNNLEAFLSDLERQKGVEVSIPLFFLFHSLSFSFFYTVSLFRVCFLLVGLS
jgi:intraflagellar transport protein 81